MFSVIKLYQLSDNLFTECELLPFFKGGKHLQKLEQRGGDAKLGSQEGEGRTEKGGFIHI